MELFERRRKSGNLTAVPEASYGWASGSVQCLSCTIVISAALIDGKVALLFQVQIADSVLNIFTPDCIKQTHFSVLSTSEPQRMIET